MRAPCWITIKHLCTRVPEHAAAVTVTWVTWGAGRLLTALRGDRDIINAVAPHPSAPVLASCGLDSSVKLWGPCYGGGGPLACLHG
jgi:hypothetical protein